MHIDEREVWGSQHRVIYLAPAGAPDPSGQVTTLLQGWKVPRMEFKLATSWSQAEIPNLVSQTPPINAFLQAKAQFSVVW